MLKILFLDHTAALSGGELSLLALVTHIDRSQFEPQVILFADGPLVAALREANIPVIIMPLSESVRGAGRNTLGVGSLAKLGAVFSSAKFVLRLARHIRQARPSIVHCNTLKADILGGFAARLTLCGTKIIWHIHDRIETDYLPEKVVKAFRLLLRWIPHYVIANSQATLETLKLPKRCRSTVVYPCVTASAVPVDQSVTASGVYPEKIRMSSCLRGEQSSPVVTLIGRISPWKGQDVFIRAAVEVLKKFPDCRFQIVGSALFGEDALAAQLKELVATLGIADRVAFLGFRKNVPEIIAASDLLVHASTVPEPFGQVIIQAMAEGKPVVATRGGGVLEIVEEGKTGLLVPMKDVDAMAKAICEILANPARAAAMGRAGQQRFEEKFTIEKTVEEMRGVYAAVGGGTNSRHVGINELPVRRD